MAIDSIRPSALDALVNHALSAPGVVVGRALYRHWNGAVGEHGYAHALEAAWSGLRNYLDQRWFFTALRRKTETYPDVIRRAIIEGNLESVLDEHLWITSQLRSLREQQLAVGALDRHPDDGAGLQVDRVLGRVREVCAAVLHLRDACVGVVRMLPVLLRPFCGRVRSNRARSARVGVAMPDACASCVRNS